ncbi:MAG: type II toxin-antitoxin system HicB family antitoxin [Chloroflexota bacterium]
MTLLLPLQGNSAAVGYDIVVAPDVAGDNVVYMASHPELPGCMAQGDTPTLAVAALAVAREEYLRALGSRGLVVPEPHADPQVAHAEVAPGAASWVPQLQPTISWG